MRHQQATTSKKVSIIPRRLQLQQREQLEVINRKVRIVTDYNLRVSQDQKYEDCIVSNDWTAFVNRAVTLVHVMRHGCPHILIRIPLKHYRYSRPLAKFLRKLLYEDFF